MVTLLTNKAEVSVKYPYIGEAFEFVDSDMQYSWGTNPYKFTKLCDSYNLPLIDKQLSKLTPEQLETFCTDDESSQLHLVRVYNLQLAHEFLNCYANTP